MSSKDKKLDDDLRQRSKFPGREKLTRPEEIKCMSKYLKNIREIQDEHTELPDWMLGVSGRNSNAIPNIDNLEEFVERLKGTERSSLSISNYVEKLESTSNDTFNVGNDLIKLTTNPKSLELNSSADILTEGNNPSVSIEGTSSELPSEIKEVALSKELGYRLMSSAISESTLAPQSAYVISGDHKNIELSESVQAVPTVKQPLALSISTNDDLLRLIATDDDLNDISKYVDKLSYIDDLDIKESRQLDIPITQTNSLISELPQQRLFISDGSDFDFSNNTVVRIIDSSDLDLVDKREDLLVDSEEFELSDGAIKLANKFDDQVSLYQYSEPLGKTPEDCELDNSKININVEDNSSLNWYLDTMLKDRHTDSNVSTLPTDKVDAPESQTKDSNYLDINTPDKSLTEDDIKAFKAIKYDFLDNGNGQKIIESLSELPEYLISPDANLNPKSEIKRLPKYLEKREGTNIDPEELPDYVIAAESDKQPLTQSKVNLDEGELFNTVIGLINTGRLLDGDSNSSLERLEELVSTHLSRPDVTSLDVSEFENKLQELVNIGRNFKERLLANQLPTDNISLSNKSASIPNHKVDSRIGQVLGSITTPSSYLREAAEEAIRMTGLTGRLKMKALTEALLVLAKSNNALEKLLDKNRDRLPGPGSSSLLANVWNIANKVAPVGSEIAGNISNGSKNINDYSRTITTGAGLVSNWILGGDGKSVRNRPVMKSGLRDKFTSSIGLSEGEFEETVSFDIAGKSISANSTASITLNESDNSHYTNSIGVKDGKLIYKDAYLGSEGIWTTLKDLCEFNSPNDIYSVESLLKTLKESPYISTRSKFTESGKTLSDNSHWEITMEPFCMNELNGGWSYLPSIQEINLINKRTHGVYTGHGRFLPAISFDLDKSKLNTKSVGLYGGEIVYPVSADLNNDLRITIVDDAYKSWSSYFRKCMEVSIYSSPPHNKDYYSIDYLNEVYPSFIDKKYPMTAFYKNVAFHIKIYILTPQYSTIKKFSLLCVLKDFHESYMGTIDAGGASDLDLSFSIVGENPENYVVDTTGTISAQTMSKWKEIYEDAEKIRQEKEEKEYKEKLKAAEEEDKKREKDEKDSAGEVENLDTAPESEQEPSESSAPNSSKLDESVSYKTTTLTKDAVDQLKTSDPGFNGSGQRINPGNSLEGTGIPYGMVVNSKDNGYGADNVKSVSNNVVVGKVITTDGGAVASYDPYSQAGNYETKEVYSPNDGKLVKVWVTKSEFFSGNRKPAVTEVTLEPEKFNDPNQHNMDSYWEIRKNISVNGFNSVLPQTVQTTTGNSTAPTNYGSTYYTFPFLVK